jgi:hypothetical protein
MRGPPVNPPPPPPPEMSDYLFCQHSTNNVKISGSLVVYVPL